MICTLADFRKVKAAQDKWSKSTPSALTLDTCSPSLIFPAYTPNSVWRNRDEFFTGTEEIEAFLTRKWEKECNYKLKKQLFAFEQNRM